jgi:hypothetical protein
MGMRLVLSQSPYQLVLSLYKLEHQLSTKEGGMLWKSNTTPNVVKLDLVL